MGALGFQDADLEAVAAYDERIGQELDRRREIAAVAATAEAIAVQ